jgi:hypothetical protein
MRTHALKILGPVPLAVVGLLVFAASSAQAVNLSLGTEIESGEPGFFLSKGTERPTGLTTETIGEKIGSIRLLIPAKSAEIDCEEGKLTEGFIENEHESWISGSMKKGAHGHKTVLFLGCRVFSSNAKGEKGAELKSCTEVLNSASSLPASHHITIKSLIFIWRHPPFIYFLLLPLIASKAQAEEAKASTLPFTTLSFGGFCALPEKVNLTGSIAIQAPATDAVKPKLSVNTFSAEGKAVQAELGAKFKFGASEAFVSGEGELELTGSGAGLEWGVM